jgi:hypothetical protein
VTGDTKSRRSGHESRNPGSLNFQLIGSVTLSMFQCSKSCRGILHRSDIRCRRRVEAFSRWRWATPGDMATFGAKPLSQLLLVDQKPLTEQRRAPCRKASAVSVEI